MFVYSVQTMPPVMINTLIYLRIEYLRATVKPTVYSYFQREFRQEEQESSYKTFLKPVWDNSHDVRHCLKRSLLVYSRYHTCDILAGYQVQNTHPTFWNCPNSTSESRTTRSRISPLSIKKEMRAALPVYSISLITQFSLYITYEIQHILDTTVVNSNFSTN